MAQWIESLLDATDVKPAARRRYISALRYWAAWYDLRYQDVFPLALLPPEPVRRQILEDFIADHTPRFANSRVTTSMPTTMAKRLRMAGFNRGVGCPSASTTAFRYYALKKALGGLGQELSSREVSEELRLLRAQWIAETASAGFRSATPLSSKSVSNALVQSCDTESISGAEDAALVLLCQRLTVRQVMALTFKDLVPGVIRPELKNAGATCVAHLVREPSTELQRYQPTVLYIGWEAETISIWGAFLQEENTRDFDPFIKGPQRKGACRENWARRRFKEVVTRAGIDRATVMSTLSPSWFRHLWEQENRGCTIVRSISKRARVSEPGAFRLIKARGD